MYHNLYSSGMQWFCLCTTWWLLLASGWLTHFHEYIVYSSTTYITTKTNCLFPFSWQHIVWASHSFRRYRFKTLGFWGKEKSIVKTINVLVLLQALFSFWDVSNCFQQHGLYTQKYTVHSGHVVPSPSNAMLCLFPLAADNNRPSSRRLWSLLNEAHDNSRFCELLLCLTPPLIIAVLFAIYLTREREGYNPKVYRRQTCVVCGAQWYSVRIVIRFSGAW